MDVRGAGLEAARPLRKAESSVCEIIVAQIGEVAIGMVKSGTFKIVTRGKVTQPE